MLPLLQRALVRALSGVFFLIGAVASQAATGTGVYVDIRAGDTVDAPVTERWRLYGASYALVIGIDNYTSGWPRLSNAVKDARLVAQALEARGFEVTLLTDVTGQQLREQLRRFFAFKGADPDARLFVWFSGHGHTKLGEGYLVPADAPSPDRPEFVYSALHMGDVGSMVRIAQSKHVLAVFDSCFAGTIFGSQRSRPPAAITAAVKRPVRQFLTSGDADQQVSDDGTFRDLFLRALSGEETSDANKDGYLTATELSLYLEDRVINLTQGAQTPRGGKLRDRRFDGGDFVFLLPSQAPQSATAPHAASPGAPAPAPGFDARALELAFWNSMEKSADPADFEDYLARYPDGAFSGLAKRRLAVLTKVAALTPPAAPTPGFTVTEMDETYYAVKRAHLRSGPGTEFDKVGRLSPGDEIEVTGKVEGKTWYRVAIASGVTAYVYAPLLQDAENYRQSEAEARRKAEAEARRQAEAIDVVIDTPERVETPTRTATIEGKIRGYTPDMNLYLDGVRLEVQDGGVFATLVELSSDRPKAYWLKITMPDGTFFDKIITVVFRPD